MAGPEEIDWVARLNRQLEPFQRAWQRVAPDIERAWRAFVVARDRGDFRDLQLRLRLTVWMGQQIGAAKNNPSHRAARVWLRMQHLTPKQIAGLLPYMLMDMPALRIPRRRGRPRQEAANALEMVEQLKQRIERTGELPTTAARRLLTDLGFCGQDVKGRADHLVRLWKNRALKSR
jgi:hypothetical protein